MYNLKKMAIETYNLTRERSGQIPAFYFPGAEVDFDALELVAREDDAEHPKIAYAFRDLQNSMLQLRLGESVPLIESVTIGCQDGSEERAKEKVAQLFGFQLTAEMRLNGKKLKDFLPDAAAGLTFASQVSPEHSGSNWYIFQRLLFSDEGYDERLKKIKMGFMWQYCCLPGEGLMMDHLEDEYVDNSVHRNWGVAQILESARGRVL
jgi:hypothetical protein